MHNHVEFSGELIERKALRFTPAGVPVVEFRVRHESEQVEAGVTRRVECEIAAIAVGPNARSLQDAQPGAKICITGFLAAKSRNSRQPTLHVNTIEFE